MQSERDTNLLLLERTICYAVVLPIAVPQKEKKLTIGSRDLELEISEVMPHWKKKKIFGSNYGRKFQKNRGFEKFEFRCTEKSLELSSE